MKVLAVLIGGAAGSLCRYALSHEINKICGKYLSVGFPYGTITVNLVGSFFVGLFFGLCECYIISDNLKIFLFVGLLGGFTTFSAYAFESFSLLCNGRYGLAVWNFVISNAAAILCVCVGFAISKIIFNFLKGIGI
jgi:CrcB protein